ncbi:MAG: Gfo/Idh/MocA family protein [Gemmatimonadales bacterium]
MNGESGVDRRGFLRAASATGIGLATSSYASPLLAFGAAPSEKVVVGVMGLNGRGIVLARGLARLPGVELACLCDVDAAVLAKSVAAVEGLPARAPKGVADVRRMLDDKAIDAIVIAAPDHWHAPAAILALQAGKHVYLEKPAGHNPREGELLVQAQRKHGRLVQVGTQRRSSPRLQEAMQAIRDGAIGAPYLARAWYANTRGTIGKGKPAPVPATLDYELWQGPAPRTPYRDNLIHYNWHWFLRWGTGEINNNGTHEIDVCRWALGVDYPVAVLSTGGRHHFADDWEFPDTQEATFEFAGGKTIIWQGQSCNGLPTHGRARGVAVLGTSGSMILDQDGYAVYDLKGTLVREEKAGTPTDAVNVSADDTLTGLHLANFVDAVRTGGRLMAPIEDGARTNLLCHLGNIAQQTGRKLRTDPASGHILGDAGAMKLWGRAYAPAWAPVV